MKATEIYEKIMGWLGFMKQIDPITGEMMNLLSIIFMILTFVGAGYVLINHGQVNAGYAVVPMSIEFVFVSLLRSGKKKDNKDKS